MHFEVIYNLDTKSIRHMREKQDSFCVFTTPCHFNVERLAVAGIEAMEMKPDFHLYELVF